MALFGSGRDAAFINKINTELINKVVDTEVEIYKLSLNDTDENLYSEGVNKVYYHPLRVACLIQRDEKSIVSDVVVDYARTGIFAFLRDALVNLSLVIQEGDVIRHNVEYYEVTQVESNQHWAGKNPQTHLGTIYSEISEHGYDLSIIVSAVKITPNTLNLIDTRVDINKNNYIPRNI